MPDGNLSVGDWLSRYAQEPDAAMGILYVLANHVAGRCARRMRSPTEAIEDLASEAFTRALENAAAALRRSSPQTTLSAWLAGAIRNLALEGCRTPYIPLDPTVLEDIDRGRRVAPAGGRPAGLSGEHDAERTTRQLRAVRLWRKGLAVRQIARQEGVTPKAVRERLARAFRKGAPESRGTEGHKAAREKRRRWALGLLHRSRDLKPLNARILRLLAPASQTPKSRNTAASHGMRSGCACGDWGAHPPANAAPASDPIQRQAHHSGQRAFPPPPPLVT